MVLEDLEIDDRLKMLVWSATSASLAQFSGRWRVPLKCRDGGKCAGSWLLPCYVVFGAAPGLPGLGRLPPLQPQAKTAQPVPLARQLLHSEKPCEQLLLDGRGLGESYGGFGEENPCVVDAALLVEKVCCRREAFFPKACCGRTWQCVAGRGAALSFLVDACAQVEKALKSQ